MSVDRSQPLRTVSSGSPVVSVGAYSYGHPTIVGNGACLCLSCGMDIEALRKLAVSARSVIEGAAHTGQHGVAFANFPDGACGATAEVLGQYLRDKFRLDAKYVCGLKAEHRSHAWLVVDNTIIDITADQFGLDPVVVAHESSWHSGWVCGAARAPDCAEFDSMLRALTVGMERQCG